MNKTITVKGLGKVSAKPDHVVISMNLESRHMVYEKAMEQETESIGQLTDALAAADFAKDELKTTNFNVRTDYEGVRRNDGSFENVFRGYAVDHGLQLEFDFDSSRLSGVLSVIGGCLAHPQLSIAFTVKDPAAVNEEVLRSAAENARRKAEILCAAAGQKLGELLTIDYNWGERPLYSNTRYGIAEECLSAPAMGKAVDFAPEDIAVSDTATFVWALA